MCFAIGLVCGLVSLLILVAIELYLGVLVWDNRRTAVVLVQALFSGLASGVIIALIEESVFRGAFFTVLRTNHGKAVAIVVTSLVYASVHFLRSTGEYHTIHWYSGFDVLGGAFSNYTDPATVGPFLALVAAGILLATIRERAGHIALTVGVHCGWVAVIKLTRKATNLTPDPSLAWLADGYDSVTGYLACIYLLIVLLAIKPLLSAPKS
ncbi:MAG: CPBP family intramembrane glutamic endopeptidase [Lentisphaeria bacterium]